MNQYIPQTPAEYIGASIAIVFLVLSLIVLIVGANSYLRDRKFNRQLRKLEVIKTKESPRI